MKKFIIVLMVVAAASFLLVGCLPGTTTPVTPVEPVEPVEPVVVATVAPIITAIPGISLTSTATQYINAAEAAVVTVAGTAPTYSEVKVYVDDVCAGTADVGVTGTFTVVIAEADLGADGDKVIYATAKEAAIAVSAKSVEYAFILDQVKPGIKEVKATAFAAATGGTATTLTTSTILSVGTGIDVASTSADVEAGTWTLVAHGLTTVVNNLSVTSPSGVVTYYTVVGTETFTESIIPGVTFTLVGAGIAVPNWVDIVCVAETAAITDRATLKFDEDVTTTAALAGVYVITDIDTAVAQPATFIYKEGNDTLYWNTFGAPGLALYDRVAFTANGVADLAGNTLTSVVSDTCVVGAASATSLAP